MLIPSVIAILGKRAIGKATSEDMVDWAVQELVDGQDTLHLRVLAGMFKPLYAFEVEEQFEKSLDELGVSKPSEETILRQYDRQTAQSLLAGTLPIPEACRTMQRIWTALDYNGDFAAWDALDSAWIDLTCGYEKSWSYHEATLDNFDELARAEARQFLAAQQEESL